MLLSPERTVHTVNQQKTPMAGSASGLPEGFPNGVRKSTYPIAFLIEAA